MLELLDLAPGLNVLEIGAGTGYNAALMAELVGDQRLVVTLDVLQDVVEQTRRLLARAGYLQIAVLWRDGVQGAAERAPFDPGGDVCCWYPAGRDPAPGRSSSAPVMVLVGSDMT
jgi:protein-L-isoaspartate(D-aspartate) O-methyltransferase